MTFNDFMSQFMNITDLLRETVDDYYLRVKFYNEYIKFMEKTYTMPSEQVLNIDDIDPAFVEAYMETHP